MAKIKKPAPKPAAKKPAPKPVAKKPAPKPVAKKPIAKKVVAAKKPAPKTALASRVSKVAAKKPAPKPAPKMSPAKAALAARVVQAAKKETEPKPIDKESVTQDNKSTSAAQLALAAPVPPPAASVVTPGPSSSPVSAPAIQTGAGTGVLMALAAPAAPSESKPAGQPQLLPDAPSDVTAQDLNTLWENLAKAFDENSNRISDKSIAGMIGKALSDWQDFFYSTEDWPADEVLHWAEIYNKTRETFELAAKPSRKAADDGTVFNVTGKIAANKKYLIAGAVGLGALGLVAATRKKHRR
jgi:RNA polymerase-binding transcription factor